MSPDASSKLFVHGCVGGGGARWAGSSSDKVRSGTRGGAEEMEAIRFFYIRGVEGGFWRLKDHRARALADAASRQPSLSVGEDSAYGKKETACKKLHPLKNGVVLRFAGPPGLPHAAATASMVMQSMMH